MDRARKNRALALGVFNASVVLAFCLWGAVALRAGATQLTVCLAGPPTCDYTTLQAAIDAAGDGDIIKVAAGHYTSGLFFLGTSDTWGWFQHNTLARNTRGAGISAGDGKIGDKIELYLYNTIIAGHNIGLQTFGATVALLQTTLWFQNDQDSVGSRIERKDDHFGDPRFAADGYHLLAGSAAIDAGIHAKVSGDIDGDVRPLGDGFDIGVDEYRAPCAVADLRVVNVITAADVFTAALRWTAPLYAVTYTLRYSESLITPSNWPNAALLTVPFTASAAGQAEQLTVAVPRPGDKVYFALKTQNTDGVWSALSNNAFWPRREIYLPLVIRNAYSIVTQYAIRSTRYTTRKE